MRLQGPDNKSLCNCMQNCNSNLISIESITVTPWFVETLLSIEIDTLIQLRFTRNLIFSKMDILGTSTKLSLLNAVRYV